MKIKYTQNDESYVLSNFSTASNPLFRDLNDLIFFIKKMNYYLDPLVSVSGYGFDEDQFQILVRLLDRDKFETFYMKKKKHYYGGDIPESTSILSQAMANLESTYAMYFNKKYKKIGAVFARRFQKIWVQTEAEFSFWLNRINSLAKMHIYIGRWRCKEKIKGFVSGWYRSSRNYYEGGGAEVGRIPGNAILSNFVLGTKTQLQAWFGIGLKNTLGDSFFNKE